MRAKLASAILVTCCTVALSLAAVALALARGAFAIPRSDDWSYLNVTFDLAQTGSLRLNGWVHMMFIAQGTAGALIARIFGPSVLVMHLMSIFFCVLGLLSLYWLARRLLSRILSIACVVIAGLSPVWLFLSATFMTDIPAWSLAASSMVLGIQAARRNSVAWLVAASGVGLFAFGIREYAVIPVLALLLWVVVTPQPRFLKKWALLLGCVVISASAYSFFWRMKLPGSVVTSASSLAESAVLSSRLMLTLALLLVPYLAVSVCLAMPFGRRLIQDLRFYWAGALLGLLVGVGIASLASWQLIGNVIHPYGSSWTSLGDGVRSLPLWGFRAISLLGALSLLILCVAVGTLIQSGRISKVRRQLGRPGDRQGIASLYVLVSVSVMLAYVFAIFVAGAPAFDRYLILVAPLLGVVTLWFASRSRKTSGSWAQRLCLLMSLTITGAVGISLADSLNQIDGLRWQVASSLVDTGIPPYKIDGGDTWFRFHQNQAPGVAPVGSLENTVPGRTWWQTFFKGSSFCRMVAIESESDLQATYGPALSTLEERTLLGTPFRVMVFPGPDPC